METFYLLPRQVTPSANDSEYAKVRIPVALMRYRDFLEAQQVRQFLAFYTILFYKESPNGCKVAH